MAERSEISSFQKAFRIVFVAFFLFLMGDAFSRWDGFRLYGDLIDFLPAVALISVLWAMLALFGTLLIWGSLRLVQALSRERLKVEESLLFAAFFVLIVLAEYVFREHFKPLVHSYKALLMICNAALAGLLCWRLRSRASAWLDRLYRHLLPLAVLFGTVVALSVPTTAYQAWRGKPDSQVFHRYTGEVSAQESRPNIILLTFDALTARDMSMYGYHRETTPSMSKWAENAHVFTRAQAASNYTFPATLSLMTGKRVWTHKHSHPHGFTSENMQHIPGLLRKNGYFNMMYNANVTANPWALGISQSLDIAPLQTEFRMPTSFYEAVDKYLFQFFGGKIQMYDWIIKGDFIFHKFIAMVSRDYSSTIFPPDNVFNRFLGDLEKGIPGPYFAWLHVMPPHDPFLPPDEYKGLFDPSPEFRTLKSLMEVPHDLEDPGEMTKLRGRYDEFIRYCDDRFGIFIKRLAESGALENTVLILSSDHGESFEHGYFMHGGFHLYEQVTHIPLIIKEPGQVGAKVINDVVEHVDISATILDYADIPLPSWFEGRSLIGHMRGDDVLFRPSFSMALHLDHKGVPPIKGGTVAVWEGRYKLIYYFEGRQGHPLLFDLQEDPGELNNIAESRPDITRRLQAYIETNLEKANQAEGRQ